MFDFKFEVWLTNQSLCPDSPEPVTGRCTADRSFLPVELSQLKDAAPMFDIEIDGTTWLHLSLSAIRLKIHEIVAFSFVLTSEYLSMTSQKLREWGLR